MIKISIGLILLVFGVGCGVDESNDAELNRKIASPSEKAELLMDGQPAPEASTGPGESMEPEYALELSCTPPLVRYNGACHIPGFFAPDPEPEVELPYDPLSPEVLVPALQAIAEAQRDEEAMQRDADANISNADPGFWDHYLDLMLTLDNAHRALDAAGQVPGVGEIADAFNAALYAAEQDWGNAGVSALATMPFLGSLGTGSRAVGRTADDLVDATRSLDDLPGTSSITFRLDPNGNPIDIQDAGFGTLGGTSVTPPRDLHVEEAIINGQTESFLDVYQRTFPERNADWTSQMERLRDLAENEEVLLDRLLEQGTPLQRALDLITEHTNLGDTVDPASLLP